jgi:translation initiation factor IF-1
MGITYKTSMPTSQRILYVSVAEITGLNLFREMFCLYCENHTERVNTLCGKLLSFVMF